MADRSNPYVDAVRRLARRPLAVRELRERLLSSGHRASEVEEVLDRLLAEGALDDLALASHYISARMDRLGHGPNRLVNDLVRRGVERSVARSALDAGLANGDLDPEKILRREMSRRIGKQSVTPQDYRRVYNAMFRAGFEPISIRRALDEFRRDPDADDSEYPQE